MSDSKDKNKSGSIPVEYINESDFTTLRNIFTLARGNQVAINDEQIMADAINYKADLFKRMRATLDKIKE